MPAEAALPAENRATRRDSAVAEVLSNAPASARRTLEKAFQGTASPRAAIKSHCLVCVNFDRQAIRECAVYRCPLWKFRPYQEATG